jgi:hypothetical protein
VAMKESYWRQRAQPEANTTSRPAQPTARREISSTTSAPRCRR